MPVIVKFIVASEENAYRVSQMAKQHYTRVTKQKDIDKQYSVSAFLNSANSFTREWLMTFEVTGEDENRQEEPLAFVVLVSANIPQEITGNKPLFIEQIVYSETDKGLPEVLKRAIEIVNQRKHDVVWAEVPPTDDKAKNELALQGFREVGKRGEALLYKKTV
jgi:hypothetical protein